MNVMDTLQSHRSIRSFRSDLIDPVLIDRLLEKAIEGSSSSGNLNSYSIIMTQDKSRKNELCKLHFDQ